VVREADLARLSPRVKRAQSNWRATVALGCPRWFLMVPKGSLQIPGFFEPHMASIGFRDDYKVSKGVLGVPRGSLAPK
jgi:hypothetical protein